MPSCTPFSLTAFCTRSVMSIISLRWRVVMLCVMSGWRGMILPLSILFLVPLELLAAAFVGDEECAHAPLPLARCRRFVVRGFGWRDEVRDRTPHRSREV